MPLMGVTPSELSDASRIQKSTMMGLPYGEDRVIVGLLLLKLYHNVTDGRMDGQSRPYVIPLLSERTRSKNALFDNGSRLKLNADAEIWF